MFDTGHRHFPIQYELRYQHGPFQIGNSRAGTLPGTLTEEARKERMIQNFARRTDPGLDGVLQEAFWPELHRFVD